MSKINNKIQLDENKSIIKLLIQNGSNPELEHKIEFSFNGDENEISKFYQDLINKGISNIELIDNNNIYIYLESTLDAQEITLFETVILEIKNDYNNLEYWGWGAVVNC